MYLKQKTTSAQTPIRQQFTRNFGVEFNAVLSGKHFIYKYLDENSS
jgi:hypothetical protein